MTNEELIEEELLERIRGNSEKIRELEERVTALERTIQSMIEAYQLY